MFDKSLAERYATAFFSVASEQGSTAKIAAELLMVNQCIQTTPRLRAVLFHPAISAIEKQHVASDVFADKISPATLQFLSVLIEAKRIPYLSLITELYSALLRRSEGNITVRAVSAWPLSESALSRIAQALERSLGRKTQMQTSVDERLLGGVRLEIEGHRVIDGSVAYRLDGMREAILAG